MTSLYLVTQDIPENVHLEVRNSREWKTDRNWEEEQIDISLVYEWAQGFHPAKYYMKAHTSVAYPEVFFVWLPGNPPWP